MNRNNKASGDNLSAPLNAQRMASICRTLGCDTDVVVLPTVGSTNSWLLESDSTAEVTLCAAEHQTIGRGRRGKTWHSPDSGVTFSIRLNRPEPVTRFHGLSLLVGALLCDQLRDIGAADAMLKWPNDVLVKQAKLAGILIETSISASAESATTVVIGIGINYRRGPEAQLIDQNSTDLFQVCGPDLPDRSELIARVASRVIMAVAGDVPQAVENLSASWADYDALAGLEVAVDSGDAQVVGRTAGIDATGGLLLDTEHGRQVFSSAEVSVRSR